MKIVRAEENDLPLVVDMIKTPSYGYIMDEKWM